METTRTRIWSFKESCGSSIRRTSPDFQTSGLLRSKWAYPGYAELCIVEVTSDTAYAEGRALTMDEAVAYALGEVTWDELADEVAARVEEGEGAEAAHEGEEASPA